MPSWVLSGIVKKIGVYVDDKLFTPKKNTRKNTQTHKLTNSHFFVEEPLAGRIKKRLYAGMQFMVSPFGGLSII